MLKGILKYFYINGSDTDWRRVHSDGAAAQAEVDWKSERRSTDLERWKSKDYFEV